VSSPSQIANTPSPTAGSSNFGDDAASVRVAAQWLVASGGAIGAILVGGLQLGSVGKNSDNPVLLMVSVSAFTVAMIIVGWVIRLASRVLVVGRTTVSDILDAEFHSRIEGSRRLKSVRPPSKEMLLVIDQIASNSEWLLGRHDSFASLYASIGRSDRDGADERGGASSESGRPALAEHESGLVAKVCDFARAELARLSYRRLSSFLAGPGGLCFSISVVVLAICLGWKVDEPLRVSSPVPVQITLTGETNAMKRAGIPSTCLPGSVLSGVALGGDLLEPTVVTTATETTAQGRSSRCPASRFKATKDVAVAIPEIVKG